MGLPCFPMKKDPNRRHREFMLTSPEFRADSSDFLLIYPICSCLQNRNAYKDPVTGTKPAKRSVKLPVRPEKIVLDPDRSILAEIHQ